MKELTGSFKIKFNECSAKNRNDLIVLYQEKYEMYQDNINEELNTLENLISLIQIQRSEIFKDIDKFSNHCKYIWESILSNESNEYHKSLSEHINKFKDKLNSILKKLTEKMRSIVTSHKNNILSLMDSFEKEMNDIIYLGTGNNNSAHNVNK